MAKCSVPADLDQHKLSQHHTSRSSQRMSALKQIAQQPRCRLVTLPAADCGASVVTVEAMEHTPVQ